MNTFPEHGRRSFAEGYSAANSAGKSLRRTLAGGGSAYCSSNRSVLRSQRLAINANDSGEYRSPENRRLGAPVRRGSRPAQIPRCL